MPFPGHFPGGESGRVQASWVDKSRGQLGMDINAEASSSFMGTWEILVVE